MKLLRFLLLTISLTTALFARAYDFEANGLYFDIISTGNLTCGLVEGPSPYTGALRIPDEVEYSGRKLKVIGIYCYLPEVSSIQIGKNVSEITYWCFSGNKLITSITFPSSLYRIYDGAFDGCTSLTTVKWDGDMILSGDIFSGCTKLKNLSYKSICKRIPSGAFKNCSSLSIDLSEVEEIGYEAFYGCKSLNIVDLSSIEKLYYITTSKDGTIDGDLVGYGVNFANCGKISLFILGSNINKIPIDILSDCDIDSLIIKDCKKKLEPFNLSAMHGNQGYIIKWPNGPFLKNSSVKYLFLGRNIDFCPNCTDLQVVKIGRCVSTLSSYNFAYCKNINNIIFEEQNNTLKIEDKCFYETNINSITLGRPISYLNYFSGLNQINILVRQPSTLGFSTDNFTKDQYLNTKLNVPYGTKELYQNTKPWNGFWNIEEMPKINADKVEIKIENTNINVGDSIRLTGLLYPEYAADTIQWKSSNLEIATISYDGLVKAVSPGKTTITAICGKVSSTCELNVQAIKAEKITLSKEQVSLNQSDTIKIVASVFPNKGTDKVKWSSSDLKVATVSDEGIVTAIGAGKVTITATCGEISATCEVTVYEDTNFNIDFTDDKLNIAVEGADKTVSIKLYSVFGECVYKKVVEDSVVVKDEIDLSKLADETYILHITSGDKNISKRIVKSTKK